MNGLYLRLLGAPEITLNEAPVTGFISNKVLALLSYLVITGRSHRREALAGLLWGEASEELARKSLSMALSNLNRLLGPYLYIDRQTVAFNRQSAYWLDVAAFCQHVNPAIQQHNQGEPLNQDHIAALEEAVELYRGHFLEGFYLREGRMFEAWALAQQQWLRQLMLQALHILTENYLTCGHYTSGIETANRLLAIEPWQEEAHRQLMLLLALSGRRNAALAQYETCRRLLAQELGVPPEEETTRLYHAIFQGDLSAWTRRFPQAPCNHAAPAPARLRGWA